MHPLSHCTAKETYKHAPAVEFEAVGPAAHAPIVLDLGLALPFFGGHERKDRPVNAAWQVRGSGGVVGLFRHMFGPICHRPRITISWEVRGSGGSHAMGQRRMRSPTRECVLKLGQSCRGST